MLFESVIAANVNHIAASERVLLPESVPSMGGQATR
jgi:hypothetical protein